MKMTTLLLLVAASCAMLSAFPGSYIDGDGTPLYRPRSDADQSSGSDSEDSRGSSLVAHGSAGALSDLLSGEMDDSTNGGSSAGFWRYDDDAYDWGPMMYNIKARLPSVPEHDDHTRSPSPEFRAVVAPQPSATDKWSPWDEDLAREAAAASDPGSDREVVSQDIPVIPRDPSAIEGEQDDELKDKQIQVYRGSFLEQYYPHISQKDQQPIDQGVVVESAETVEPMENKQPFDPLNVFPARDDDVQRIRQWISTSYSHPHRFLNVDPMTTRAELEHTIRKLHQRWAIDISRNHGDELAAQVDKAINVAKDRMDVMNKAFKSLKSLPKYRYAEKRARILVQAGVPFADASLGGGDFARFFGLVLAITPSEVKYWKDLFRRVHVEGSRDIRNLGRLDKIVRGQIGSSRERKVAFAETTEYFKNFIKAMNRRYQADVSEAREKLDIAMFTATSKPLFSEKIFHLMAKTIREELKVYEASQKGYLSRWKAKFNARIWKPIKHYFDKKLVGYPRMHLKSLMTWRAKNANGVKLTQFWTPWLHFTWYYVRDNIRRTVSGAVREVLADPLVDKAQIVDTLSELADTFRQAIVSGVGNYVTEEQRDAETSHITISFMDMVFRHSGERTE